MSENSPDEAPSFLSGLLSSLIPLAVAVGIAAVGFFFFYLFWFGTEWIFG